MQFIRLFLLLGLISNSLVSMEQPEALVKPSLSQRINIVGPVFAAYMRDNKNFIVGTSMGTKNQIYITDTQTYTTKRVIDLVGTDSGICDVSPDNKHLVADDYGNPLTILDIETKASSPLPALTNDALAGVYNNLGNQLLISKHKGALILDLRSNQASLVNNDLIWPVLTPNPVENNSISVLTCLCGEYPHKLSIWDLVANKFRAVASFDFETTTNAQWSNDGQRLIVGGAAQLIECDPTVGVVAYYNLQGKKVGNKPIKVTPENNGNWPLNINFMPGEQKRFFSGTTMNKIIFCDLEDDTQSFSFQSQSEGPDFINAVAIDHSGNYLAAGNLGDSGNQSLIQLWDISGINEQKQAALNKAKAEVKNAQKISSSGSVCGHQ